MAKNTKNTKSNKKAKVKVKKPTGIFTGGFKRFFYPTNRIRTRSRAIVLSGVAVAGVLGYLSFSTVKEDLDYMKAQIVEKRDIHDMQVSRVSKVQSELDRLNSLSIKKEYLDINLNMLDLFNQIEVILSMQNFKNLEQEFKGFAGDEETGLATGTVTYSIQGEGVQLIHFFDELEKLDPKPRIYELAIEPVIETDPSIIESVTEELTPEETNDLLKTTATFNEVKATFTLDFYAKQKIVNKELFEPSYYLTTGDLTQNPFGYYTFELDSGSTNRLAEYAERLRENLLQQELEEKHKNENNNGSNNGEAGNNDGGSNNQNPPPQNNTGSLTQDQIKQLVGEYTKTSSFNDIPTIMALIESESGFDPKKVNENNNGTVDRGLMQINSGTAPWLASKIGFKYEPGVEFDPEINIGMGVYYLSYLKELNNDPHFILTAYNRGPTGAKNWYNTHKTYESEYSKKVLSAVEKYK